jgi:hypothetical protein
MLWGNEFVDVTDRTYLLEDHSMKMQTLKPIPAFPAHQDLVKSMLTDIDVVGLEEFVKVMSTTWFNRWRTTTVRKFSTFFFVCL